MKAGKKNCMKEAAWGVCVVLCPAGQEPTADVHPSFTEVIFIKKVQKSLNGCDASGILSEAECGDLGELSKGAGYVPRSHVPYLNGLHYIHQISKCLLRCVCFCCPSAAY